jgi:hypothetical protein
VAILLIEADCANATGRKSDEAAACAVAAMNAPAAATTIVRVFMDAMLQCAGHRECNAKQATARRRSPPIDRITGRLCHEVFTRRTAQHGGVSTR